MVSTKEQVERRQQMKRCCNSVNRRGGSSRLRKMNMCTKINYVILLTLLSFIVSSPTSVHAIGKKIRKFGVGSHRYHRNYQFSGSSHKKLPQVQSSNGYDNQNDDNAVLLDSFLLYRGGDNTEENTDDTNNDENDVGKEDTTVSTATPSNTAAAADTEENDTASAEEKNVEKMIHVSLHSSASTTGNNNSADNGGYDESSSQKMKQKPGKKYNAVGDPNGNDSSSDSESDEEDEEEEEELRKEMMEELRKEMTSATTASSTSGADEEGNSFEVMMELASRREGMKLKIEEMERELEERKKKRESEEDYEDLDEMEYMTDVEEEEDEEAENGAVGSDDEEEEEEEEDAASYESTSYHMAGTDVAKEDEILKRQRKYKRGSVFKKDRRRSTAGTTTTSTTTDTTSSSVSTVKTTIDSDTMDRLLISAFQSMIFLPPPVPRLPSPDGSMSLRNIDVSSRRRLDRRTLYHGLLAELGGSHHHHKDEKGSSSSKKENVVDSMIRRKYLDPETARALKGALSLACQPRWRERLMVGPTHTSSSTTTSAKKQTSTTSDSTSTSSTSSSTTTENNEEEDDNDEYADEEVPGWWYRGGVCLFPPMDDDELLLPHSGRDMDKNRGGFAPPPQQFGPMEMDGDNNGQGGFFGRPDLNNDDEMGGGVPTPVRPWRCTMGMQETVAMALAHSLSCGLALIDDEALASVRKSVEASLVDLSAANDDGEKPEPTISPDELRNAALLGHLLRLANEGKLSTSVESAKGTFGRISDRMERDMNLGLDDPNDDLAVESLRLMKEDERTWYENDDIVKDEGKDTSPLPLVLFVRSDSSSSILKSKSAVECLAHECVNKEGIHLLMLGGKGIDASTTVLPDRNQVGAASGRMKRLHSMPNQQGKPFSFMSNFPPGSPEFSSQMQNNQKGQQFQSGSFSPNNINASGVNDPEGSRRFNIFLTRTVDQFGKPQIMGTIAPPQAGNLFPTILSNMATQNLQKIKEKGIDEDNEQQAMFIRQMEEIVNQAQKMAEEGAQGGDSTNAAFFNATISSPFGAEVFNNFNGEGLNGPLGSGQFNPPPEAVRRAIQDAMSGVIDRLAQMSSSPKGGIPMNIAKAFSQVLSNENLRRGIAENLSRAAPALIDPRCQGVMLSVYVPPGPDHANVGMMPGDQFKNQKRPQQQPRSSETGSDVPNTHHGMGGWLNKILSSSSDKGKSSSESPVAGPTSESEKVETTEEKSSESSPESQNSTQSTKGVSGSKKSNRKSKRKERMDRARTLAVAAAALAGSKKEQKERERRQHVKLTQEQKAQRNLTRLQALCRNIPIPNPIDPVRLRSWDAWADREQGSVVFRRNRGVLVSNLNQRSLGIDDNSGTKGAGIVLRQMMSVRDLTEEMDDIIKCAVEIEAGKSQRHHESPWGVVKPPTESKPKTSIDKTLVNFLLEADESNASITQFIHPHSLESALSLICGVSPSPGSQSSASSSGALASHRTKEDLMALAQDKHERALIPNCVTPQDIGVTYDMIGGLTEVKELLRQSITYPLKFPHLYSEGIAKEAVKGVLLFGPPGEYNNCILLTVHLHSQPSQVMLYVTPFTSQEQERQCSRKQ